MINPGFLFLALHADPSMRPQLCRYVSSAFSLADESTTPYQISLPKSVADAFNIRNNTEVTVTKSNVLPPCHIDIPTTRSRLGAG